MRFVTVVVAMVFALSASAAMYAQGRGGGQAKKTTASAPKAKSTQGAKTTKTTRTETRVAKADARAAKAETRMAKNTAKTDTTTTKAQTKAVKLNAQQQARFTAVVPAGMTVEQAAAGFKNRGQFQAAINASANHGISFEQLKSLMTGIPIGATEPTATPMSLGQALQTFGVTDTTTP